MATTGFFTCFWEQIRYFDFSHGSIYIKNEKLNGKNISYLDCKYVVTTTLMEHLKMLHLVMKAPILSCKY